MAVTYYGSRVVISPQKVPSGILKPTVTTFSGGDYKSFQWVFEIDKASVEASSPADTFNDLVNFLDLAISTKLMAEFISTNTVEAYGHFYEVDSNLCTDQDPNTSDAYKNIVPAYICKVNVKVKIS